MSTSHASTNVRPEPARTLSIVGLVFAIIMPLIGLIISLIARGQSRAAGYQNGVAKAGIIISIILLATGLTVSIITIVAATHAGLSTTSPY